MGIKVGDIVEGQVIDFSHEGNGVIRVDNFTVFVRGGLIGDHIEAKIEELKKNYALGRLERIIQPSSDRIDLDFQLEESRGSIPLIKYRYESQLEWKKKKVESDIKRIAGLENVNISDTIGMDNPYRYRNHTQIPVGLKDSKLAIGFYEMNSNEIVDMEGTILQAEIGDRIIAIVRQWMNKYDIKPYDRKSKKGVLRHIGIRTNKDMGAMVILVSGSNSIPREKELVHELSKENVVSIYHNINRINKSVTYGRDYRKIYGEDKLIDYLGNYEFRLSPQSFFQVNRSQAEVLYEKAIEFLEPNKEDVVFDLYSGIGTISLYIANEAKKVYGIESVAKAIEDAKENARINNIDNVEFIEGKAEEIFPKLLREGIKGNKLIVDPPRKGCEKEVLEAIVDLSPERVVYVSCNPSTMARDIKYLVEHGYSLGKVQPVDMFPHTGHVECIALIQREIM